MKTKVNRSDINVKENTPPTDPYVEMIRLNDVHTANAILPRSTTSYSRDIKNEIVQNKLDPMSQSVIEIIEKNRDSDNKSNSEKFTHEYTGFTDKTSNKILDITNALQSESDEE